jgi:two-component system OmpR family sensor kinase
VRLDAPPDAAARPISVHADADRLRQAVLIALDNAIRYSSRGDAVRLGWQVQHDRVDIMVVDEGIGIDAEELPVVFQRFVRGRRARTHRADGTGIGLSIAQAIVQAHHGDIRIESVAHRGTTVHIELPCRNTKVAA